MRSSTTLVAMAVFLLAQCCLPTSAGLPLPKYIKPCSRNDPNLNACALKHGREALPEIIKGDRTYNVPPMNPFLLEKFTVDQNDSALNLGLIATELKMYGVENIKLEDIKYDLKKQHYEWFLSVPELQVTSLYEIAGKLLILPIKGHGDANVTFTNVEFSYKFDLELTKKDDGLRYGKLINTAFDSVINGGMYVTLNNLFNGDKLLGNAMNDFINENWRDIEKELHPSFTVALTKTITGIIENIFEKVSYDDTFPETV